MELSTKERILLINQFKILKHLNKEDTDSVEQYQEYIDILQKGYTIFYNEIDYWVSEEMPMDASNFVIAILNLYSVIEAYKQSNPEDKGVSGHVRACFRGFDGNTEAKYLLFTNFLIDEQHKYREQLSCKEKLGDFNSHVPMLDIYKNMLSKWSGMGEKFDMSKEELLSILDV